ncbi:Uu.00g070850.m01.CDS01 [Anthostomella pinea]|uniref:Uu.00g070850.m01.CDS01 n=1 Tax=Anthostomella pinea TaxID=933095 RepID=A0AAI8VVM2_9PEZI|nr:Uu.00g070850.m01.CDS01 [Anthostomella pinea]
MDLKTATTRLRRTFAYPTDTTTPSSSPSPSIADVALDEQEQEELIHALAQQNASRNAQFRLILLALPVLSALPYIITLSSLVFSPRRSSGSGGGGDAPKRTALNFYIALLALSSLGVTAWTLWSLPPGVTGIRALDAWVAGSKRGSNGNGDIHGGNGDTSSDSYGYNSISSGSGSAVGGGRNDTTTTAALGPLGANAQRRRRSSFSFWAQHRSPLEQYLPFLNMGLCAVLVVTGVLSSGASSVAADHWGHVGLGNLPAIVYVVVLVAKMVMGSVDPERELVALRYEFKGA